MQNEDYIFNTREAAEEALRRANENWDTGEGIPVPQGKVLEVHFPDEMMEPKEGSGMFVAVSEDGEYMVPNYEPWEWFLV